MALSEERTFFVKSLHHVLSTFTHYKDEAQFWGKALFKKLEDLRSKYEIKDFIVTGAPFSPIYHMAKYKEQNPEINLIIDLRDPWMQLLNKSHKIFNKQRKIEELENEAFSFKQADKIILVTETFKSMYQEIYPESAFKMTTIFNGYDPEDFCNQEEGTKTIVAKDVIKIAYAGALFKGRAIAMGLLVDQLASVNFPKLIVVDIFSNQIDSEFQKRMASPAYEWVSIHAPLPQAKLFERLNEYDYLLTINTQNAPFAFGTKVFEYIALEKKVILISPKGELYDLLEEHDQFVANYETESILNMINELKKDVIDKQKVYPSKLKDRFNIKVLTNQVVTLFSK